MVEGAKCPECGKPVSNTSIRANAPVCTACGVTLVIIDGTLGCIPPYRVLDHGTSRKLAEANLAVFREQLRSYRGMQGDCKQKLKWSVQEYAEFHKMLPQPPELLELEDVTSSWKWFGGSVLLAPVGFGVGLIIGMVVYLLACTVDFIHRLFTNQPSAISDTQFNHFATLFVWGCCVLPPLTGLYNLLKVMAANGRKPEENARREREFEKNMAIALKKAESAKETSDFQLGVQIRELEGYIRTAEKNEAEVLQYLATLR